jgi:hypothetical protein
MRRCAPACEASFSEMKKNFVIRQWKKWWGSERGTPHYPVTSEWKGAREETAILKWVNLQLDYIDRDKLGNLLATSRSRRTKENGHVLSPLLFPCCGLERIIPPNLGSFGPQRISGNSAS